MRIQLLLDGLVISLFLSRWKMGVGERLIWWVSLLQLFWPSAPPFFSIRLLPLLPPLLTHHHLLPRTIARILAIGRVLANARQSCVSMEYAQHPQSQVVQTSWAVLALIYGEYPDVEVIKKACALLMSRQKEDGRWEQEDTEGIFNKNCAIDYPGTSLFLFLFLSISPLASSFKRISLCHLPPFIPRAFTYRLWLCSRGSLEVLVKTSFSITADKQHSNSSSVSGH